MKLLVALSAVLASTAALAYAPPGDHTQPLPRQFRYMRSVGIAAGTPNSACAVLDEAVYEHARASLDDVRLFSAAEEVPYALTVSNPTYLSPSGEQAKILNLGMRHGHIVFDLAMPDRSYSTVDLHLTGADFLATANVSGADRIGARGTDLGASTLFDLSGQNLGRSTALILPESTFHYLHVDLELRGVGRDFNVAPDVVTGASVPPSREAQTLYTEVMRSSALTQDGNRTVATFVVPARVPIERVRFEFAGGKDVSFSRAVTITAHPEGAPEEEREEVSGTIMRVRVHELGQEIRRASLSLDATLGANSRMAAQVVVSVANGDDHPLPISAVVLEMRQRKLCFPVPAAALTMFYGDSGLQAPQYDFSQTFQPSEPTRSALLGPEQRNPEFKAAAESRSFADRHPALIWAALLGVIAVLGLVALSTARRR